MHNKGWFWVLAGYCARPDYVLWRGISNSKWLLASATQTIREEGY